MECNCILDEFNIYDFNGSGDRAALAKLSEGGDTADSDEYLADTANDYTFDFNDDDSSNRGEYVWLGSDSRFQGANVNLATNGVDSGALFSSDFEGADSNLCDGGDGWTSGTCESGNTAVGNETSTVYNGTYAAKLLEGGTNDADKFYKTLSSAYQTLYVRMYFRLAQEALSDGTAIALLAIQDSVAFELRYVEIRQTSGNLELGMTGGATTTWAGSDGYLQLNRWYSLELKVYRHATSGTMDLWLNGSNILSMTSLDTGDNDLDRVIVGLDWTSALGTYELYVDNVSVWDGTMDYDWEYWDGDSWSALTIAGVHGLRTDAFLDTGSFFFTDPGDWRPYSMNGSTDLYYIRGHLEGGTYSTDPIEDTVKTDILLVQYLSNITANDQTFVVVPENLWALMLFLPVGVFMVNRRRKQQYQFLPA